MKLNRILDGLPINDTLSDVLNVTAQAEFRQVANRWGGLEVEMRAKVSGSSSTGTSTYAPPTAAPNYTTLDPVRGEPYDFAASISLEVLNQLLLVKSDGLLKVLEIAELD